MSIQKTGKNNKNPKKNHKTFKENHKITKDGRLYFGRVESLWGSKNGQQAFSGSSRRSFYRNGMNL